MTIPPSLPIAHWSDRLSHISVLKEVKESIYALWAAKERKASQEEITKLQNNLLLELIEVGKKRLKYETIYEAVDQATSQEGIFLADVEVNEYNDDCRELWFLRDGSYIEMLRIERPLDGGWRRTVTARNVNPLETWSIDDFARGLSLSYHMAYNEQVAKLKEEIKTKEAIIKEIEKVDNEIDLITKFL